MAQVTRQGLAQVGAAEVGSGQILDIIRRWNRQGFRERGKGFAPQIIHRGGAVLNPEHGTRTSKGRTWHK